MIYYDSTKDIIVIQTDFDSHVTLGTVQFAPVLAVLGEFSHARHISRVCASKQKLNVDVRQFLKAFFEWDEHTLRRTAEDAQCVLCPAYRANDRWNGLGPRYDRYVAALARGNFGQR